MVARTVILSARNGAERRGTGEVVSTSRLVDAVWGECPPAALRASVSLAVRSGLAGHAWRLAWALSVFLLRRGCWEDQARACQAALDAARRAGDVAGEAHALLLLALGDARTGRRDAAPALRTLDELGHPGSDRVRAKISVPGDRLPAVI